MLMIRTKSSRSYVLCINGNKYSVDKMGESCRFEFSEAGITIQAKLSNLPRYYPFYARLFDIFPQAKSPSIYIKTNRKQSVYTTCESSDSSLARTLKRWGAIFLSWFHLHQKPYTLSFTEVSENVFNKQKTEK